MADEVPPAESLPSTTVEVGPWLEWPSCLGALVPEAARAAGEVPFLIIWHFQLAETPRLVER